MVENGQVVVRPMNYLAQSYDHRIIDGREAVLSLVAIKEALEDPARVAAGSLRRYDAMAEQFDVVVIGAGPGGYIAAIRAAQLGFKTACIDDWTTRRRQARARRHLHQRRLHPVQGAAAVVGELRARGPRVRRPRHRRSRASRIDVAQDAGAQGQGRRAEQRRHPVPVQEEQGRRSSTAAAAFAGKDGDALADQGRGRRAGASSTAKHVIVATGSKPRALPGAPFDNERVLDNDGALAIPEVPKRLGVVGAGVIGLEMGSVWRRLGAEVTMLEALPAFLGAADERGREGSAEALREAGARDPHRRQDHRRQRRQEGRHRRLHRRRGQGADARRSTS